MNAFYKEAVIYLNTTTMKLFSYIIASILFFTLTVSTSFADQPDTSLFYDMAHECEGKNPMMEIYPNPLSGSKGYIVMKEDATGTYHVELASPSSNSIVYSDVAEVTAQDLVIHMSLEDLSEGIYILRLTDSDGCRSMQRVMKR